MREAVMSAGVLGVADEGWATARARAVSEREALRPVLGWSPEHFAREEIRRLVRQIFTAGAPQKRQIVFSAADPETDIRGICMRVGEALAMETAADVAVVAKYPEDASDSEQCPPPRCPERNRYAPLRVIARQLRRNLWVVPADEANEVRSTAYLHTYLGEVRREFEYSIVQNQSAGVSDEAAQLGRFADGIILVLSAQYTRRAAASKIKQALEEAQVRLLGVVLTDREFPIPERVYRRL